MSTVQKSSKQPAPGSAKRRALPQARSASAPYEIVFPKKPPASSAIKALFGFLRDAWGRGGDTVGDAYAAGARVVLDRKEALEDLNAERRHRPAATAAAHDPAQITSGR